jgi:zinc D-Ala-D-Ala carboxypeptidase
MNLTKHFTLSELCNSETAARKGLDNHPTDETISQLKYTCAGLERIRQITNAAIVVTSGYRSPSVNQAIGGKVTSQHCKGEAADITCPAFGHPVNLMDAIVASKIDYDQLILEYCDSVRGTGWVHISFTHHPRKQALIIDKSGTRVYA